MSTLASFQNQVKPNWCPGCGDYAVQMALQQAAVKLNLEPHQLALVSGIGCSGRIGGYLYAYGMHTTHGRALPFAQGVKLAKPELTVIACGGDGDGFAIGTAHTIHAMRRNVNITYILMDNHVYGLTKGQTSPRSDVGFKTKTTPTGNIETPIAALELALASGATFVAQGFSAQLPQLVDLIVAAVRHEGFSFVNVFSPCVTFNHTNTYEWFREHLSDVKDIAGYDPHDKGAAARHIMEKEGMLTGKAYPKEEFSSMVVQQGFGGADVGLDASLTFEQEGALTPGKIAHFDELNTWTQSGTSRMIRKDDWKLVMNHYGNGELYNLKKDPSEVHNLFGEKKYSEIQTELLTRLLAWELRLQDPLPLPQRRYHFKQNPFNYLHPEH